jgi:Cd2+/Zn2+-exporting ATPase
VVFDKTGTLTCGSFAVQEIYAPEWNKAKLLELAALAESASSHPISLSIQRAYGGEIQRSRVKEIREISGLGVTAVVDGMSVAVGNRLLMQMQNLTCAACEQVGTVVHIGVDGKYAGYFLIRDQVKSNAKAAVDRLRKMGIEEIVMLTGDHQSVAQQVATELGIGTFHSQLLPEDKVSRVEDMLRNKPAGKHLAFVGDGINDAPVLARGDIGIAMGAMGSDAAIEAADVVLMDDDPLKIAKAIKISRKCMSIVYQNVIFALGVKGICLILGAFGIANMWLAIFADVGVMVIAVLNAIRALFVKRL